MVCNSEMTGVGIEHLYITTCCTALWPSRVGDLSLVRRSEIVKSCQTERIWVARERGHVNLRDFKVSSEQLNRQ